MVWNALTLACREIRRNLLRSALTVLGIVAAVFIGVFGTLSFQQGNRLDTLATRMDGVVAMLADIQTEAGKTSVHMEYVRRDIGEIGAVIVGGEPAKKASLE